MQHCAAYHPSLHGLQKYSFRGFPFFFIHIIKIANEIKCVNDLSQAAMIIIFCLFVLMLYIPVNIFSVILG